MDSDESRHFVFKLLRYLVTNSIAFHDATKGNRKITLHISTSDLGNMIEVTDNGVGIADAQQNKVFDVFFKGSESSMGAGMGLFLAQSLAEKIGGSISCESEEGSGTTIRMCFPK